MTKRKQEIKPRSMRRWIILGPGILLAIILALQLAINNHQATSTHPIIEHQVVADEPGQAFTPAPEIGTILRDAPELKLTDKQIESLNKLQAQWEVNSKPLTDQLDRAANKFRQFMKKSGSKISISDIQSHAGPVSELSGELSSLRRVYWEKAQLILDKKQQQAVVRMSVSGNRSNSKP